jgi:hypothetical protein
MAKFCSAGRKSYPCEENWGKMEYALGKLGVDHFPT